MQMEKSIDIRKQARSAFIRSSAFQRLIIIAVILLLYGFFFIASPSFRKYTTLVQICSNMYYTLLMAIGVTFPLITGGNDLSMGTGLICYSLIGSYLMRIYGWPLWAAIVITIAMGVTMGYKPIAVKKLSEQPGETWYYLDGTPASCVKFGVGDVRVDNSSSGGIICGVEPETGRLSSYGLYHDGSRCTRHPDLGYACSDMTVPHPEKAFELVKRAHMHMDRYGIIGWDVTIDEEEEAVLVEANLCLGSINAFQVFHGPLFGRDTKKILDEVFRGKRRLLTTLF